ncbi:pentatricopeptide repeat-containing protein, mitochondrial-like isoform X1 [Iris pallida]|uniref:Pentatricopeptide repeat-containing protein, mitochondrial-like isoform X1 n=1 Tax=Iris pallida TaxID=29817 RepID=A0AAX6DM45_IRIPA|nr:pentatricopeptide repeat-containing protein, mitochondrial-like isoform X1 [Iris pallida]
MRKKLSKILCSAASRKTSGRSGGGGGAAGDGEALSILKRISLDPQPFHSSPSSSSSVRSRLKSSAKRRSASPPQIHAVDSAQELSGMICNILQGDHVFPSDSDTTSSYSEPFDAISLKNFLGTSLIPEDHKSPQKKIVSRVRKQLYVFKNTQSRRYNELMKECADKIGAEATMEMFGRFGRETGIMEYKTLTKLCIAKARQCTGDDSLCFIDNAYQLLSSMRERGFRIDEESYGPILMLLIDMRMTQEFQSFSALIKDENPGSFSRMAYYEMLFWIRVGDEDKIRELSNSVGVDATENCYNLAESYLLAFCDSDRKEELLELLEVLDVSKISSLKYAASIFKSLGRLQLENFFKKFILTVKTTEPGAARASSFIYDYVTSIPNLAVDEIKSTFINLHNQLGVLLSIETCDMLIKLCCSSSKVHHAMDVVDQMCQSGLDVPVKSFHPLLHACERHCEFDLVGPIYSMIRQYKLIPNSDTFKSMISLYVRMKDFEGAYKLLTDAAEINEVPTASMYNAIMAGYFREAKK